MQNFSSTRPGSNEMDKINTASNPPANLVNSSPVSREPSRGFGMPISPAQRMPVFHKGTDKVKQTGPAILKKGEAVLNTHDAAKYREAKGKNMSKHEVMDSATDSLAGHKEEKPPKKEIKHIITSKAKSGGYIHKHVHTHPETHPDEDHVSPDQDAMAQHMLSSLGEPNPGEQEADAGQSGTPGAGAAPTPQAGPVAPSPTGA